MLSNSKTTVNSGAVLFQKVLEVAQGGFTLDDSGFSVGATITAGTPIGFDETTRLAKVAKVAVLHADAANNATTYQVKKGHYFKVGSSINLAGGTARAITVIDTSNAGYDVLTVGTTIGAAASAGANVFISDAGYTAVKGLLYSDVVLDANGLADIAVVLRGTVYDRRIVAPIPASVKTSLPLIIFSQSF